MTVPSSAGARLRAALAHERPLQVVGTVNSFSALLAERDPGKAAELRARFEQLAPDYPRPIELVGERELMDHVDSLVGQ